MYLLENILLHNKSRRPANVDIVVYWSESSLSRVGIIGVSNRRSVSEKKPPNADSPKKMLVLNSERQFQFSLKKSFTNLAKNTLVREALMEPDTAAIFRSDRKTYGKTYV